MSAFIQFALFGLATGGIYALVSMGVVLVYRGGGIVNFAQGAMALFGAATFYEVRPELGVPAAVALTVIITAVLGLLIQVAIMWPMRRSSPLARVVATLGVLTAIEQAGVLKFGTMAPFVTGWLPSTPRTLFKGVTIPEDRFVIMAVAVVLTVVLAFVYRRTRFGLATTSVVQNERAAASLGWSPAFIAGINWAIGGALAGLAGCLLAPITGLDPSALTLTIIPALAAALVGGFGSFGLSLGGALAIGIIQSEVTNYVKAPGWVDAVPFLVIIFFLVIRGRALPLRSHLADRLPRIGTGRLQPGVVVVVLGLTLLSLFIFTNGWIAAVTTTVTFALVCLSIVIVTGYAGQLSLAQYTMAGIGAFISGRLAAAAGLPFFAALVVGVIGTALVAVVIALPAVRVRGVNLAVVTMGLAVVVNSLVLDNPNYTGGVIHGTVVKMPHVFGLNIGSVNYPRRYAIFTLIALLVGLLAAWNIRRGRSGRRLIAVRDNERAAASLGVNIVSAKLYAFAVGGALAGLAGVLMAFRYPNVQYGSYDPVSSIQTVMVTVIGGVGYIGGAIIGGTAVSAGVVQQLIGHWLSISNAFLFWSAIVLLLTLLAQANGAAHALSEQKVWLLKQVRTRTGWTGGRRAAVASVAAANGTASPDPAAAEEQHRVPPQRLELQGVTMRFGATVAVNGLDLVVEPGKVVGLIGPNGAGKTTVVDVATGFHRSYSGSVVLGQDPIDRMNAARRARVGLTRSFQSLELFDDLTVAQNIAVAADRQRFGAYFGDLVRPRSIELTPAATASIREFGLSGDLDRMPSELPYAKRRLVAIARAVATSPSVLLLDEPAAGLDATSTRELGVVIRRLADVWGMAILLIEHDVPFVLDVCDNVTVLNFGATLASGPPAQVRNDPQVVAAYIGTSAEDPEPQSSAS